MATTTAVFRASKDAGEPLDITLELTASDLVRYTVPAGGPFVTGAPQSNTLTAGAEVLLSPLTTIAANTLTNPMTAAHVLLFTEVSEGGAAANLGPAVERAVITRHRDQTVAFGDLNFMCPSAANSSLHMRRGSNPSMTVTHFSTKWSNQQGAASEQTPTFTVTTGWRIFRSAGLNLTQHNNWQEGTFVCNGWLYNIQVFVGSGWNNNRFSCTRWRLDAVKGDPGADGANGINGTDAASIDHVSQTAGDSSPGTTDTYTLWADAAETTALGTYDVPIPAALTPVIDVDPTIPDASLLVLDTGTAPPTLREAPATATSTNMERVNGTVNRDFTITLGPFQFRVPTSGINSIQHRYTGGGTTTILNMYQWAHAGGLRNSSGGVTSGSGWQYFTSEWNMTAVNQMHNVEFEHDGWFYELSFTVRDSFIQNPYSYKRTRM